MWCPWRSPEPGPSPTRGTPPVVRDGPDRGVGSVGRCSALAQQRRLAARSGRPSIGMTVERVEPHLVHVVEDLCRGQPLQRCQQMIRAAPGSNRLDDDCPGRGKVCRAENARNELRRRRRLGLRNVVHGRYLFLNLPVRARMLRAGRGIRTGWVALGCRRTTRSCVGVGGLAPTPGTAPGCRRVASPGPPQPAPHTEVSDERQAGCVSPCGRRAAGSARPDG
jgi:hypothetical protein